MSRFDLTEQETREVVAEFMAQAILPHVEENMGLGMEFYQAFLCAWTEHGAFIPDDDENLLDLVEQAAKGMLGFGR